jgi:hypothetical protein
VLHFYSGQPLQNLSGVDISPFIPQFADFFLSWGMWKYAVAAVGLVLLSTAVFQICPAYMLFGIRTCRTS